MGAGNTQANKKRVEEINSGINPIKEELGLEELAKKMRTKIIVDGRGIVDRTEAQRAGFLYLRVGAAHIE